MASDDVNDRFLTRSAVFIALRNKNQEILLLRRANTGYMDGRYDLPAGHVERNETLLQAAVRELQEETGIVVQEASLRLWHINQFAANGQYYYNFFFVVDEWKGEPSITEPDKCDDMGFFAESKLPPLAAGSHIALDHQPGDRVSFGYIDQLAFDQIAAEI
jgi:8-oxo-dGTP diphosphatase